MLTRACICYVSPPNYKYLLKDMEAECFILTSLVWISKVQTQTLHLPDSRRTRYHLRLCHRLLFSSTRKYRNLNDIRYKENLLQKYGHALVIELLERFMNREVLQMDSPFIALIKPKKNKDNTKNIGKNSKSKISYSFCKISESARWIKTLDDNLSYIPNDARQNYLFCRLKLFVDRLGHL